MPKKYIIANWKMNLNFAETLSLAKKFKEKFSGFDKGEVAICPSTSALHEVGKILKGGKIKLGAQNAFWEETGAYTGEVSPGMLAEIGCRYVILGHSERRKNLFENYEIINKKVRAVVKNEKLIPVICIGESFEERKTDRRDFILVEQLEQALSGVKVFGDQRIIIAYEPIWAIGTGTAIEPAEAEYAHKIIKLALNDIVGMRVVSKNFSIIYGGSISSKNVKSFANLEDMNGLLVGGASLKADEFLKIAKEITK
ncbi:MAG: triose-phosphate isomerase [Patescibacteria group bacterium]|nr:triose-phosphate isomerase [Patescibacteria group bacterium]